jgi:hypothetical protein
MKTLFKCLAILTVLALPLAPSLVRAQDVPPPPEDQGDQGVSFQNFYDQLGDQGTWVQTDDYGYVFQPNVSDPTWAPYTDGHWVYTDEGWTWVSDEPWGWATYHYGRWANIDGTGWVWVPGYQWAPAWVSWRYGGGYCGWAPLPPESFIGAEYGEPGVAVGIGFHFGGDVDVSFNIGPGCYNFVSIGDMGEPNYRGHFLDRSRNFAVINRTTNITNININKTVINNGGAAGNFRGVSVGGPTLNEVNAHARQHIPTVQLTAANQPGRSTLKGNSLAVYAPRVNAGSVHQARPTRVAQTLAHPMFNRGDSVTKPLAVTATVRPPAPTPAAIQAAQTAQLHAPANARIATEKTTVKTPLNKPLTSLEPVAQVHRTTNATTGGGNGANTVRPTEHPAGSAPFTGETAKSTETHPNEVKPKPTPTYHPQTQSQVQPQNEAKPSTTYHPQSQVQSQNEAKPSTTYHPQSQVQSQNEAKPSTTYHPQSQVQPQNEAKPSSTYHPQSQVNHEPTAPARTQAAPPARPSPAGGGQGQGQGQGQGNKPGNGPANKNDKNNPQGQ